MLDVCLLGSGGMMPLPYRFLTSLMTRFNGSSLMIDCGEGTQVAVKEKARAWIDLTNRCDLFYSLSWGSYQWTSGSSTYNGKCRP